MYTSQPFWANWGDSMLSKFTVGNRVKQGRVLLATLFGIYANNNNLYSLHKKMISKYKAH